MAEPMLLARVILGGLCGLGPLVAGARAAEPATAPVVLDPVRVTENYEPKLSFGLSLDVWKDDRTGAITSIVLGRIQLDSDAEREGLTPLLRVLRIDGRPVEEFEATFRPGSELHQIFVGRRNGDKVTLEIWFPGETVSRLITLTERRGPRVDLQTPVERFGR